MANHIDRNLFSFLITAALFTSVVDGRYDAIAMPPVHLYNQAVFSPPSPQAFLSELQSSRRWLIDSSPPSVLPAPPELSPGVSVDSPPPVASGVPVDSPPPIASTYPPPKRLPPVPLSPPPDLSFDVSTHLEAKKKTSVGVVVGALIAGIAVFALIGVAGTWRYKKKKAAANGEIRLPESTQQSPKDSHTFLLVKGTAVPNSAECQEAPTQEAKVSAGAETTSAAKKTGSRAVTKEPSTRLTADRIALVDMAAQHFTYKEILKITGNFGMVIGEGGSSTVYYGKLQESGLRVAVKKLKESGSQIGDLLAEMMILMRIHHKNLVSLVGICQERDEIILVSEYMAHGNLFELLKARSNTFTWRKRLQVALDAATGLEYLHTGCRPSIIHRDIKSTNILLDENLEAKLADFGLSKTGAIDGSDNSYYHTKVAGTVGYIDPEYLYTQTLTKKSDVYSFGVVLFELITGKPAVVITEMNEKLALTNWVMPMLLRGEMETLLDPLLNGHCSIESVWEVAAIAKSATQHPSGRPNMSEIISTLKAALSMETLWVDTGASEIITSQPSFREIPHNPAAR